MDLRSTYDRIAKDWMADHHGDTWWQEGLDKYVSLLESSASVLDIGCGPGVKTKEFAKRGFDVTGIDFSEEMIRLAKEQVPSGKFFVKDIKKPLGFTTVFDGIFAQAVLLHIPKKKVTKVIRNITESLKSGGYLYIAVKELKPGNADEETVKDDDYGYTYERFFSYFTLDEVKNAVKNIGMKVVYENVTSSGKTHWIQVIAQS